MNIAFAASVIGVIISMVGAIIGPAQAKGPYLSATGWALCSAFFTWGHQ